MRNLVSVSKSCRFGMPTLPAPGGGLPEVMVTTPDRGPRRWLPVRRKSAAICTSMASASPAFASGMDDRLVRCLKSFICYARCSHLILRAYGQRQETTLLCVHPADSGRFVSIATWKHLVEISWRYFQSVQPVKGMFQDAWCPTRCARTWRISPPAKFAMATARIVACGLPLARHARPSVPMLSAAGAAIRLTDIRLPCLTWQRRCLLASCLSALVCCRRSDGPLFSRFCSASQRLRLLPSATPPAVVLAFTISTCGSGLMVLPSPFRCVIARNSWRPAGWMKGDAASG